MEHKKIIELKAGEVVTGFFLIKSINCKTASNNKKFLDITLSDQTGDINAKLWDCSEEDESKYKESSLVKVQGSVDKWKKSLQIKIEKIRPVNQEDNINIEAFVPSAPVPPEVMYQKVWEYIDNIKNEDIKNLVTHIVEEYKEQLLKYPAAKHNHHAIRSGLLYHITTMLKMGEKLSEIYTYINTDLLFAGIILHDIAKIDEMDANELGIVSDYTVEGQLLGHIIQGIKKIEMVAHELGVDKEISLLLQHMILSHHYEPEFGSPKKPMIPEAELLHFLDIIDARMYDTAHALKNVEENQFTEKVWTLDNRRLYKAKL